MSKYNLSRSPKRTTLKPVWDDSYRAMQPAKQKAFAFRLTELYCNLADLTSNAEGPYFIFGTRRDKTEFTFTLIFTNGDKFTAYASEAFDLVEKIFDLLDTVFPANDASEYFDEGEPEDSL